MSNPLPHENPLSYDDYGASQLHQQGMAQASGNYPPSVLANAAHARAAGLPDAPECFVDFSRVPKNAMNKLVSILKERYPNDPEVAFVEQLVKGGDNLHMTTP